MLLLGAVAALLVIGLDMVYSSSFVLAHNAPQFGSDTYFLTRQLLWASIGSVCLLVTLRIDYHRLRGLGLPLLGITLVLLVAVLFSQLGHTAYGAQRWLTLGPLPSVQPSELAKLALILFYAGWLADRRDRLARLEAGPLPFAAVLAVVAGLIMIQPDFGSAFTVVVVAVCMFWVAGAQLIHMLGGLLVGGTALVFLASSASYRSNRLAAFFNASEDPLGIGWHSNQASIALGSGGIIGRGLGASRQKFFYLFGAHTDSIYAVIGEELGLLGTILVLALFVFIAYRGLRIALDAPDAYGTLLASGISSWLIFQALINMLVATSTIPFTGIPLPFVSFGGSSLLVSLIGIGMLLNISRYRRSVAVSQHRPATGTRLPIPPRDQFPNLPVDGADYADWAPSDASSQPNGKYRRATPAVDQPDEHFGDEQLVDDPDGSVESELDDSLNDEDAQDDEADLVREARQVPTQGSRLPAGLERYRVENRTVDYTAAARTDSAKSVTRRAPTPPARPKPGPHGESDGRESGGRRR